MSQRIVRETPFPSEFYEPRGRWGEKPRFIEYIEITESCWLWSGPINYSGYGVANDHFDKTQAHRWVYERLVGPIPNGLTLDHLCRVRHCVNPDHLEPVTNKVNVLRGTALSAQRARQTHCKRGHLFDEANTYITKKNQRICRTCRADYERGRRANCS